jgi:hypothetical protein
LLVHQRASEARPHAVPLSFVVINETIVFATASQRAAARNAVEDPGVVLVLGGYGDAIRVLGRAGVRRFDELDAQTRSRYIAKAGWDPGDDSVALVVTLSEIHCSRSPAEDLDRIVWQRGDPTSW